MVRDGCEVTAFQTVASLQGLIENIEREIARLLSLDREKFLERFGPSLVYLAGAHGLELAADD